MPKWILEYYYIPYTWEESQRRMQSSLIIFNKYLYLKKITDIISDYGVSVSIIEMDKNKEN